MYALRDYVDEGPVGKRRLPTLAKEELSGGKAKPRSKPRLRGRIDDEDEDEFENDDDFEAEEPERNQRKPCDA